MLGPSYFITLSFHYFHVAVIADNSHKYADEDVDSDLGDWDVSSEDEEEIKKKEEEEKKKKEDDKLVVASS